MDLRTSSSEGGLYKFDNKVVDQNYFTSSKNRNYSLGLPGWHSCINCTAKTTSTSTVAIIDNKPDEVIQCKNVETVYSKQLNSHPLSLNRHRKCVPSEDCLENPAAVTEIKKLQKRAAGVLEKWFSFDIVEDDLETFKKGECPSNTTNSTEWAMKNLKLWHIARNVKFRDQCPECWFEDKENLCGWLCRFIAETRKADGGEYTPRSIYLFLAGLQWKIRQANPIESINIFNDAAFKELQNICDSVFKRLHQKGIGSETRSTPVLIQLVEDKLWESGVLDLNTPIGLLT